MPKVAAFLWRILAVHLTTLQNARGSSPANSCHFPEFFRTCVGKVAMPAYPPNALHSAYLRTAVEGTHPDYVPSDSHFKPLRPRAISVELTVPCSGLGGHKPRVRQGGFGCALSYRQQRLHNVSPRIQRILGRE